MLLTPVFCSLLLANNTLALRCLRSQHVFWVVAKDGGFPPKTSLANLTVMVTDVNDVAPVFPSNMATHLQEHLSSVLPRTIYQV